MTGMGSSADPHSSLSMAARTSRRPLERQPEQAESSFPSPGVPSSPSAATAAAGSYAGAAGAAGNDWKPAGGEETRKMQNAAATVAEEARAFAERERRLADKRQDEVCFGVVVLCVWVLVVLCCVFLPPVCSTSSNKTQQQN